MNLRLLVPLLLIVLLAACVGAQPPQPAPTVTGQETASPNQDASAADSTTGSTQIQQAEETAYPVEELLTSFGELPQVSGDTVILYGQVLDVNGDPVPNTVVEIWQTDASGVYDHPNDPGTDGRDTTFQFFGAARPDDEGWYAFRTVLPGEYQPRPRHVHFKVKVDGSTLLTSQFYFSQDVAKVQGESIFQTSGESGDLLLLQLVEGDGAALANGRIVVDTGVGSGKLSLTPSQAEGPYYPVVSVADYDNDLITLP